MIPVPRNSGTNFKLEGVNVTGSRYNITHFYYLAVEAGFNSDMVECVPVDPAAWVQFPAWAGKIFSLYDTHFERRVHQLHEMLYKSDSYEFSFFLLILARSNYDHYARECNFGILMKNKNKTKKNL